MPREIEWHQVFIKPSGRQHSDGMRTRSDDRHLSADDVKELRQFIDVIASQKCSDRRDARIICLGLADAARIAQFGSHGAKFPDAKRAVVTPISELRKEYRAGALGLDRNSDNGKNRQQENEGPTCHYKIENAFRADVG